MDFSSSPRMGDVYQRDLEANYCKNFSCCGLTLNDMHALLQHYEESHVRFEEDDLNNVTAVGFTDDDDWSSSSESAPNSPKMGATHLHHHDGQHTFGNNTNDGSLSNTNSSHQIHTPLSFLNARKKSTGVSLSDIYSEDSGFNPDNDAVSAFPNSILRTAAQAKEASLVCKKRDLSTFSSSFDTQSPLAKKISSIHVPPTKMNQSSSDAAMTAASILGELRPAGSTASLSTSSAIHGQNNNNAINKAAVGPNGLTKAQDDMLSTVTGYLENAIQQGMLPNCGEVGSPSYLLAAEDLIRKRDEIVSMMESIGRSDSNGSDKPYRCTVSGCDKAYKNPNGLKYHNQHGHCSVPGSSEDEKSNSKPYRCTFLECGKCYKNLNGLKYHIEHSHPNLAAALHAHIPGFATLDGSNVSQAAIAAAAAIAAVQANPMMMAAANAIMASAAAAAANNTRHSSLPSDHSPESSPNSSPTLSPIKITTTNLQAYRNVESPFSTDVTPMTSPTLTHNAISGLNFPGSGLSINTLFSGSITPSALSPTFVGTPRSPNGTSQVSTLTAALAAVNVEQQQAAALAAATDASASLKQ